ncbi:MAG TPA: cytidine deaminase [Fulvivirga sp.]|nr:cytidine deaminase [Fulvivirga sp.]
MARSDEKATHFIYEKKEDIEDLYMLLIKKAEEAFASSYSPYSNFEVGAAALLENGEIISGSNQENAAYPSGLCAERVSLFQAGARFPNVKIIRLAVVAKRRGEKELRSGGPCGMCRQVMLEYEQKQSSPIEIIFKIDNENWIRTKTAASLLPFSFGKDNL